jgi:DNA polymerase I-like protein with 3'-5' exonuclease and polymerase domains
VLARYDVTVAPIDDTMLMSYALHAGLHGHGMDTLSERYLDHSPIPIKELIGSGQIGDHLRPDRKSARRPAMPPRMPTSPAPVAPVQAATARGRG